MLFAETPAGHPIGVTLYMLSHFFLADFKILGVLTFESLIIMCLVKGLPVLLLVRVGKVSLNFRPFSPSNFESSQTLFVS